MLHLKRAAIMVVLGVLCASSMARAQAATQDQIKAAYMFNFAKFVEWPAEALSTPASPMNFCALGRSAAADELDSVIEGKSINGHPVRIRHLGKPEDIKGCHLVFLATGNARQLQQLLQASRWLPILVVGDAPGFAQAGGMIGFITENGKVLFEVNPGSAEESHLKISSKLLALARIVNHTPESRAASQ